MSLDETDFDDDLGGSNKTRPSTDMSVIELHCEDGLTGEALDGLHAGDSVELTGRVISLRDASAARVARALGKGEPLPLSLKDQILYAVGPSPPKPGQIIGSAGPTTTARMARFLPALFKAGVRGIIGKGELHGNDMAKAGKQTGGSRRKLL